MSSTVIYLDILIFLNAVVDYFLLLAAAAMSGRRIKEVRLIISCIFASFTSLYIFAPKLSAITDLIIRLGISMLISLVAFGYKNAVDFLKAFACVLAVTLLYNGLAVAFWTVFKPSSMVIKNSVVYFDISAVQMIVFSIIGYIIIRLVQFLVRRFSPHSKRVSIRICNENSIVDTNALVDSGNSLKDIYSSANVVITDFETASRIFNDLDKKPPLLLPYNYVGGSGLIKAYYCDSAEVNGKVIKKVLVAVSENNFDGDYRAIVSPDILEG